MSILSCLCGKNGYVELLEQLRKDHASPLGAAALIVSPQESIQATIERMRSAGEGCALIASGGKLTGVFTERDVLTRVLAKGVKLSDPVSAVMTPDPVTIRPDAPVGEVLQKMDEGGLRHLPIVQSDGTIDGIVSVRSLINYLVEYFPESVFNLPPSPGQILQTREGA